MANLDAKREALAAEIDRIVAAFDLSKDRAPVLYGQFFETFRAYANSVSYLERQVAELEKELDERGRL